MEKLQALSAIIISPRRELREAVREQLARRSDFRLDMELTQPFTAADAGYLEDIQLLAPGVVFLDFEADRRAALELAHLLSNRASTGSAGLAGIFGVGATPSAEFLLEAMRAGVSEYFPLPFDPIALDNALDRVVRKAALQATRASAGQILTFFGLKGGSGATTIAANTAVALQRSSDRKVVLVDLNPEMGDLALLLGVRPKKSVLDLSKNLHRMDEDLLMTFLIEHSSGLRLLSAPPNHERSATLTPEQIRQIFNLLKSRFDFVLVDMARAFYDYTLTAFDQADRICLIANVDLPSLRNTQRCLQILDRLGFPETSIKLIINRFQAKDPTQLATLEQTLRFPVFQVLSNDYATVNHAINTGKPFTGAGEGSETLIARQVAALAEALVKDLDRPARRPLAAADAVLRAKGLSRVLARRATVSAGRPQPHGIPTHAR